MANREAIERSVRFIYANLRVDKDTVDYLSTIVYRVSDYYAEVLQEKIINIIMSAESNANTIGEIIDITRFIVTNFPLNNYTISYLDNLLTKLSSPSGNYYLSSRMKLLKGVIKISYLICDYCWYTEEEISIDWRITKKGNLRCVNCDEKEDFLECDICDEVFFKLSKKNNLKCDDCGEKFIKVSNGNTSNTSNRVEHKNENKVFIDILLGMMTKLFKADGEITAKERDATVEILTTLGLDEKMRSDCYSKMNQIKRNQLRFSDYLEQYLKTNSRNKDRDIFILKIMLDAAFADGIYHHNEEKLIKLIVDQLQIPFTIFNQIYQGRIAIHENPHIISEYYKLFDCQPGENIRVIRKKLLELQKKYHPDNLSNTNVAPEIIKMAEDKIKQINVAYEILVKIQPK